MTFLSLSAHDISLNITEPSQLTKKGQKSHNAARWSAEAIMEVSGYRMVGGVVCEGRKNTRWGIYG